jgi:Leucine-rich repeat (LRR) protein
MSTVKRHQRKAAQHAYKVTTLYSERSEPRASENTVGVSWEAEKRINNWLKRGEYHKQLNLSSLKLSKLPPIPMECTYLICDNNKLTHLPDLPNCDILWCANNKLEELPNLPKCEFLACYNNKLTRLPYLPRLGEIMCDDNEYLYISKVQAMKYELDETPNYTKYAKIIQRTYRKYRYNKHLKLYLVKNTIKLVYLYLF